MVSQEVFPFIKNLHGGEDTAYARHMKDAIFMIPTPSLLERVVEQISQVPMEDRDTKGDLYEYMLSKLTTAGRNGQFRTPRHIIKMMVELMQPRPDDIICDPACGTAGFLVAAGEYLREHHADLFHNEKQKRHFNEQALQRLRLRLHHAAHRQHEHDAARRGEPGHRSAGRPLRTAPATLPMPIP